jgi:hypothetical protein
MAKTTAGIKWLARVRKRRAGRPYKFLGLYSGTRRGSACIEFLVNGRAVTGAVGLDLVPTEAIGLDAFCVGKGRPAHGACRPGCSDPMIGWSAGMAGLTDNSWRRVETVRRVGSACAQLSTQTSPSDGFLSVGCTTSGERGSHRSNRPGRRVCFSNDRVHPKSCGQRPHQRRPDEPGRQSSENS